MHVERPRLLLPPPKGPFGRFRDLFRRTRIEQISHQHNYYDYQLTNGSVLKVQHTLRNDDWIRKQCVRDPALPPDPDWQPMISPFSEGLIVRSNPNEPMLSWGLSGFGYDVTLAPEYKIFSAERAFSLGVTAIDPKKFDDRLYIEARADTSGRIMMPPQSFLLCRIKEYLRIPNTCLAILFNKSTYARCGVHVTTTIMEPGWHGEIVVEITNAAPLPVVLYANEGIGQLVFLEGQRPACTYADRNTGRGGKYQGQTGITTPRMELEPALAGAHVLPAVVPKKTRVRATKGTPATLAGTEGTVDELMLDNRFTVHWDGDVTARSRPYSVENVQIIQS